MQFLLLLEEVCRTWICVSPRTNGFIKTHDIIAKGKKMSTKKKKSNPKKVDFLDLSDSEKAHLLKEAKDNLRLKLVEARFWQSLAETEKITINGQTIQFEDINLKGPTYE